MAYFDYGASSTSLLYCHFSAGPVPIIRIDYFDLFVITKVRYNERKPFKILFINSIFFQ